MGRWEYLKERKKLKISYGTYYMRLKAGWPKELAATTPVRKRENIKNVKPLNDRLCQHAFGFPVMIGDVRIWRCTMFGFDLYKIDNNTYRAMYHSTKTFGMNIQAQTEIQAIGKAIPAAIWYNEHLKRRIRKYKEAKNATSETA